MGFTKEQTRAAKRLKLPLVEIRVDERFSKQDGVGGSVTYSGVATQEFADRASELMMDWPPDDRGADK